MKNCLYLLITILLFVGIAAAAPKTAKEITGAHLEAGITCSDCHEIDVPEKRASQKACIQCHGDMTDSVAVKFKSSNGADFEVSPHASHTGQMRCTLCHLSHSPSTLYCNDGCHHEFVLDVP